LFNKIENGITSKKFRSSRNFAKLLFGQTICKLPSFERFYHEIKRVVKKGVERTLKKEEIR